ncbi:DUF305 domain-containing protein [Mumia sp. zg.B17]|uniref:DUF305 domain-containing protein n=1 Tax=Mumia sp. zg.B17 TaxID=2855446 RepID=UPI001C6EFF5E|nr:DUF305 domain-containing protein [Mumia sp. zg.B17]MBW9204408.1 DUF305 domain-containing protein [Mumia sp. zg.B17]
MTSRSRRPVALTLVGLVLTAGALTACSEDGEAGGQETSPPPAQGTVLQPGRPGEPNASVAPEDYPKAAKQNEADVDFITMMITHHLQALEMTELAKTRAEHASVRSLSDRISASQGPEIHAMVAWLEARGLPVPEGAEGHGGHGDHGPTTQAPDMAYGMLTDDEMKALAGADGNAFDQLFLRGMIEHHSGAVAMAETAQAEGSDLVVSEIAADVASGQGAEIARMQVLLDQVA